MPAGVSRTDTPVLQVPRTRLVAVATIVSLAPLVLLVFNRDWLLTREGWTDPWHYVGLFREYGNPDYSPGAYKLARLPWILSGALVTRLLPPLPAAYVLHAVYLCAMTLALFAGTYSLFRRLTLAAVVALCLGFYTHAHGSGGWDYHNTAAGAFYLATFAILVQPAALGGGRGALIGAGVFAALAVHSNITLVNFLPALALIHLAACARAGTRPALRLISTRMLWTLVGALVVTVGLGLINMSAGREFLFFRVLVDIVVRYVGDTSYNAVYQSEPGWYLRASYLAWLAGAFACGVAVLIRLRRPWDPEHTLIAVLILQYLGTAAVWVGWQAAGQTALNWSFFAYVLVPGSFIALAAMLRLAWPESCERHWLAVSIAAPVVLAVCLGGAIDPIVDRVNTPTVRSLTTVVGASVFSVAVAAFLVRPGMPMLFVFFAVLAFGNRLMVDTGPDEYGASDPCKSQPETYLAIVDAASWLGDIDPSYTRVRLWFDEHETLHPVGTCTVSVYRMGGSIASMAFVPSVVNEAPQPAVDDMPASAILAIADTDAILAIVTNSPETVARWQRRVNGLDLSQLEVGRHDVALLQSTFTLHAWRLAHRTSPKVRFADPFVTITEASAPDVNVYGAPKGGLETTGADRVFRTTDRRDHLAWSFVTMQTSGSSWARVTIDAPAGAQPCRVMIQDQGFRTQASSACQSMTRYVLLSPDTTAIRVVIMVEGRPRSVAIPRRVEVSIAAP